MNRNDRSRPLHPSGLWRAVADYLAGLDFSRLTLGSVAVGEFVPTLNSRSVEQARRFDTVTFR